jgi:hypothetical protein
MAPVHPKENLAASEKPISLVEEVLQLLGDLYQLVQVWQLHQENQSQQRIWC